jgi:hypothetical protein
MHIIRSIQYNIKGKKMLENELLKFKNELLEIKKSNPLIEANSLLIENMNKQNEIIETLSDKIKISHKYSKDLSDAVNLDELAKEQLQIKQRVHELHALVSVDCTETSASGEYNKVVTSHQKPTTGTVPVD